IGNGDEISTWVASDQVGTSANPLNPLVGPLHDNGGPTPTMALLFGSGAIDAGDNANGGLSGPAIDQRGLARIANGTIDIGAFEVQHSSLQDSVAAIWQSGSGGSLTLLVDQTNIADDLAAVANLTPNPAASQPAQVVFDLGGNTVTGQTVSVP